MRIVISGVIAYLVSACATSSIPEAAVHIPQATTSRPLSSLPAQDMAPGACGLFLFGVNEPFPFLVFEREDSGQALVLVEGAVQTLPVIQARGVFVAGERFSRDYGHDAQGRHYRLEGEVSTETGSGPGLINVLMRVRQVDGADMIRPLGGVYSCNTGD